MKVQISNRQEDMLKVTLQGELNKSTVPTVRNQLIKWLKEENVQTVEIDCSFTSGMDTAGVALLVEVYRILKSKGVNLRLSGCSETAKKMIRLARLERLFEFSSEVESEI